MLVQQPWTLSVHKHSICTVSVYAAYMFKSITDSYRVAKPPCPLPCPPLGTPPSLPLHYGQKLGFYINLKTFGILTWLPNSIKSIVTLEWKVKIKLKISFTLICEDFFSFFVGLICMKKIREIRKFSPKSLVIWTLFENLFAKQLWQFNAGKDSSDNFGPVKKRIGQQLLICQRKWENLNCSLTIYCNE